MGKKRTKMVYCDQYDDCRGLAHGVGCPFPCAKRVPVEDKKRRIINALRRV